MACEYVKQLEELLDRAILATDDYYGVPNTKQIAEYLIEHGIVLKDDKTIIQLPCPIGTTLYRIDSDKRACSYHWNTRDNMYYCINDSFGVCEHLCDGKCDAHTEYKIYTIENASAMAILSNAHLFGTRVFLNKEEAEKELEKKRAEAREEMLREAVTLPDDYEGYRDYWEEGDDE